MTELAGGTGDPSTPRTGVSVLLVEDDDLLAGILARHLGAHGHQVTVAPTAEEALTVLDAGLRPSIVLLDINLPGETGWSLIGSSSLVAAGDPPVVVASAMAVSPDRLRAAGAAGFLPKPYPLETLLDTVERLAR